MSRVRRTVLAALLAAAPAAPAAAAASPQTIHAVDGAIALPPQGAPTASGTITLVNDGPDPATLVSVRSPRAARTSVHVMSVTGGIMHMRPSGPILVPAHGRVVLSPASGRHLMFSGLTAPLRAGDLVPVTLSFARGAPVRTALPVKAGEGLR